MSKTKIPLYDVVFDPNTDKGVFGLSVVNDPAMESLFIALSKDDKPKEVALQLAEINKEQRILLGVALIPDKEIYRNVDGNEFYIKFSADTVKEAAHGFLKNQYNNNSSIEHDVKLSGVSIVESWIVTDANNDKSNVYGLNAPVGSWVASMKVDNDELWNDYAKTGKIKGFSIDGLFSLKEINLNTDTMPENDSNKSVIDALKDLVKSFGGKEVNLSAEAEAEEKAKLEAEAKVKADAEAKAEAEKIEAAKLEADKVIAENEELKTKLTEALKAEEVSLAKIEELKLELSKVPATKGIVNKPAEIELAKLDLNTMEGRLKAALNANKN